MFVRLVIYLKLFLSAEGTPHLKAYDEESVASISTVQDETQDSFQMNNGTPNSNCLFQGGYMLAASYWPKVNSQSHAHAALDL